MQRYIDEQENLDFRAAIITCIIANVNRDPKKKHMPFKPQEFMPSRRANRNKKPSGEPTLEQLRMINETLGGEEIKDGQ